MLVRSAARLLSTQPSVIASRLFSGSSISAQQQAAQQPSTHHTNFYKSHGRALFKSLTLAFFSYQVFYWAWLTLETETMKDEKGREIKALEEEVKMLSSGQGSHVLAGKRVLDEESGSKT